MLLLACCRGNHCHACRKNFQKVLKKQGMDFMLDTKVTGTYTVPTCTVYVVCACVMCSGTQYISFKLQTLSRHLVHSRWVGREWTQQFKLFASKNK